MKIDNSYFCLDLSSYFNNKGITSESNMKEGMLSLGYSSFPEKGFPNKEVFYYKNVPFKLAKDSFYDNVELSEQIIEFPQKQVESVYVLGVANNGDFFEKITFLCNGERVEDGDLHFTDFMSTYPVFNNELVYRADYLHTVTGKYTYVKPILWYDAIHLQDKKNIDAIQVEDNPSMHIFAITLKLVEKEG